MLIAAVIYYFSDVPTLFAFLMPVAAHEMGHFAALSALKLRVRGMRLDMRGLCIEYTGSASPLAHALAAAAGPAAGILYALAAAWVAGRTGSRWASLSAGISTALTAFNLLPALPMDGGRIFTECCCALLGSRTGGILSRTVGASVGALMLAAGLYAMHEGYGAALEAAAVWVLLAQPEKLGIVNPKEIM